MVPYWISSLRHQIATTIVAFPIFIFLNGLSNKEAKKNPGHRISPIRRWLTYITLFIAASFFIGDLISLTRTFLQGEITLRFFLKVLTIGAISGVIFTHYSLKLKRDEFNTDRDNNAADFSTFFLIGTIFAILIVAIWNSGSPFKARLHHLDEQRIQDLISIQGQIETYAREHKGLPANLEACNKNPNSYIEDLNDPVTGKPYHFRLIDPTHVEIGAEFSLPTQKIKTNRGYWSHPAGLTIFILEVHWD